MKRRLSLAQGPRQSRSSLEPPPKSSRPETPNEIDDFIAFQAHADAYFRRNKKTDIDDFDDDGLLNASQDSEVDATEALRNLEEVKVNRPTYGEPSHRTRGGQKLFRILRLR